MIMHSPVFEREFSENTDVRITYDDECLYIGARLYYPEPGLIRSASYKRDFEGMSSDWFGLIIDTYKDKENAMVFSTTPERLKFDAIIQRGAVITSPTHLPMNLSWNTFYVVITKQDSEGWSLEMRIPLSTMRFKVINGDVRMGLIIQRWISAKNENDTFPAISPNWSPNSIIEPSQAQDISFQDVESHKPLYITPYLFTGY